MSEAREMLTVNLRIAACGIYPILLAAAAYAQEPNLAEIIQKSVAVNTADFKASTEFNWTEIDQTPKGPKKFRVMMIEGTPYYRLIGVNGEPLSSAQNAQEQRKEQQVIAHRRAETRAERQERIEKFEKERTRDNALMEQMTKAFNFTMVGQRQVNGYSVFVLKATRNPGYRPPSMETQVLTGMRGELWIEQNGFHWVKVTAEVIHPVSIEGFLARVNPGTRFELEQGPVGDGKIWQPVHFSMRSNAKVLFLFERESQEDDSYSDYQPVSSSQVSAGGSSKP
jgi:hypothetical protein